MFSRNGLGKWSKEGKRSRLGLEGVSDDPRSE
jgi:hypothetical protein